MSRHTDVPSFGPPLPKNPLFACGDEFRDFILSKIVNADSVGNKIGIFTQIRMRTRNDALEDLIAKYSSKFNLDNGQNGLASTSGISLAQKLGLTLGSIKPRKIRSKSLQMFNSALLDNCDSLAYSQAKLSGAIFWSIDFIEDFQYAITGSCYLGISRQYVVVVEPEQKCVLFSIGCNAVIGWTINEGENRFVLYFDQGECIFIRFKTRCELNCVIKRLEYFTKGCKVLN